MVVAPLAGPIAIALMGVTPFAGGIPGQGRRGRRARAPGEGARADTDEGHGVPAVRVPLEDTGGPLIARFVAGTTTVPASVLPEPLRATAIARATGCQAGVTTTPEARDARGATAPPPLEV